MALFDDFDWAPIVTSFAKSVPAIAASTMGARTIARGNTDAANMAAMTGARNEAIIRENADRGAAARAPVIAQFRATAGMDPGVITPAQKLSIDDTERFMQNKNLIGTVGGRSMSRMIADSSGRMRANAVKDNTARVDAAGRELGALAGQETQAGMNNTNALVGNNNNVTSVAGNAVTGTANAEANTYGQIATMFANQVKDADRESRYKEYKTARV